jgi:hypothetical protein
MGKKSGWKKKQQVIRVLRILMQVCFWGCVAAGGLMIVTGVLLFVKPLLFLHLPGNALGLYGRIRFEMNGFLLFSLGSSYMSTPLTEIITHFQPLEKVIFFYYAIPGFAFALFFHQFYRLLHSVEKGRLFAPENAKRLTIMGLIPIILSVVMQLARLILVLFFMNISEVMFAVELGGVFFGLVLLILARIFKHGQRLQDEYDATV